MLLNRLYLIALIIMLLFAVEVHGAKLPFSVAFYYGRDHPVNELRAFDVVVVDPDGGLTPAAYGRMHSELFAYVSAGEADPARSYTKQITQNLLIGDNKDWKSRVVDVSSPQWRTFFLDKVIEPLWQAGYRGFFLDTLDSYQLAAKKEDLPRMEAGLVAMVRTIRQRHPEARLILNRGFEIFDRVKDVTFAVVAESLFQNFKPASGQYGTVPGADHAWLIDRLNKVSSAGVPVIVIDYVSPSNRPLMRQTAEKIKSLGFIPWVTDKDLNGLGVGAVEVLPRTIIGLYDSGEGNGDLAATNLQRHLVMPLNYLGYTVEMHDMLEPLPAGILAGRYAGAVVWPFSPHSGEKRGLRQWALNCIDQGVPLVFLEHFGVNLDTDFTCRLGLEVVPFTRLEPPVRIVVKDALVGFEQQPLPNIDSFVPVKVKTGRTLLQLSSANDIVSDAVAITPWGGYVAGRHVVTRLEGQAAWVLDPFRFFSEALKLPEMPVPDTTTENGVRLLLAHVDGTGFESRAEWPGGRLAAEELRSSILERYRIPTTISMNTGILAPNGLYPRKSAQLEKIAQGILALPWVEGASIEANSGLAPKIPPCTFDMATEISGSLDYINKKLMPSGKKARIFQWSDNCLPREDTPRLANEAGLLNINGGTPLISDSNHSLTAVAPLGISRGRLFQVYAPSRNENIYTNHWTENFYGYRRVIESFQLTDTPRRLKPVNIHYQFHSASKEASLNALRQVYDWAAGRRLFSIYTSEYIEKILDFNQTVVARDGAGWLVRNSGSLRELRVPIGAGYPELSPDSNLAGYSDLGDSRYLHMVPGGEARVRMTRQPPAVVTLESANGFLDAFERNGRECRLTLRSSTPFSINLAGMRGCRLADGVSVSSSQNGDNSTIRLPEGRHAFAVTCK